MNARLVHLACCFGTLLALVSGAFAQPSAFTYQGRLTGAGGPANGSFEFEFGLHAAATGGSALETKTVEDVEVTNGLFTVTLDFSPAHFTGTARWLEIAVRPSSGPAHVTLAPRQPISPNPYALYSYNAGVAALANSVPAGSIQSNHLAAGAVGASQLTPGAAAGNLAVDGLHLVPSGGVILSEQKVNPAFIAAGYRLLGGQIALSPDVWTNFPSVTGTRRCGAAPRCLSSAASRTTRGCATTWRAIPGWC